MHVERDRLGEERATLRAGLVTSAILNVHRRKGTRPFQPTDFVRRERKHMTPEQAQRFMDQWAQSVNRRHENGGGEA